MTLFVCFPIFCCRCTPSLQVISEKNKLEAEPQAPLNSEKLKSIIAMEQGREIQAFLLSNEDPMLQEYDTCCEASRLCFRQSQYSEEARPHENFSRLWELCCQWLQPQLRSLDQVLELLVLEQFFAILPTEIETRVRAHGPESRERLFELIEHLQREREASGHQVRKGVGSFVIRPGCWGWTRHFTLSSCSPRTSSKSFSFLFFFSAAIGI